MSGSLNRGATVVGGKSSGLYCVSVSWGRLLKTGLGRDQRSGWLEPGKAANGPFGLFGMATKSYW